MTSKAAVIRWFEQRWYGDTAPGGVLRWLERLYTRVVTQRRREYLYSVPKMMRVGVPVIAVGNLTVGGAGKTPLTIALVEGLRARGFRPGVVSRGYGRRDNTLRRVTSDDNAADVGDEPLLIARRTGVPVVVCPGRYVAARTLEDDGSVDVIVADDALQHYSLLRDIEILVIDGRRGLGNTRLLPAGPLREPVERGNDCDFVVVNAGTFEPDLKIIIDQGETPKPAVGPEALLPSGEGPAPDVIRGGAAAPDEGPAEAIRPSSTNQSVEALITRSTTMHLHATSALNLQTSARTPLTTFANQRAHAVAAIADPERFFTTLRQHGIDPIPHPFPDHHAFTAADLAFDDTLPVLMTEKDAVKCTAFATDRMFSVPIDAILPDTFLDALADRVRSTVVESRT